MSVSRLIDKTLTQEGQKGDMFLPTLLPPYIIIIKGAIIVTINNAWNWTASLRLNSVTENNTIAAT